MRKLLYANYILIICLFTILLITAGCGNDKVVNGLNIQGSVSFYENPQEDINITITDLATEKQFMHTTDSSGQFSQSELWHGEYKITPQKEGYYFEPAEVTVKIAEGENTDIHFEQYLTWQNSYNNAGFDIIKRVYNVYDNSGRVTGYIFAGIKENAVSFKNDFIVKKIDMYGNDLWERTFGEIDIIDNLTDFKKTGDAGYILCGTSEDDLIQGRNIKIIKIDNNGNQEWEFTTNNRDDEYAKSIDVVDPGNNEFRYIVTGNKVLSMVNNINDNLSDAILIMLDNDGNVLNASLDIALGNESWDSFNCVKYLNANEFISAGYSEVNTEKKVWVRKYNNFPNLEWQLVGLEDIGISGESEAADFIVNKEDRSSAHLINYTEYSDEKILVMKLDADKNLLWQARPAAGFTIKGYSINHTSDNGYVVCGSIGSRDFSDMDVVVYRLNSQGEILWSKEWDAGFKMDDIAYGIAETYDEGFVVVGSTLSGAYKENMFINKINRNGEIPVDFRLSVEQAD